MSFKFESSYDGLISRADLKKLFWRSIPYEHSWNYERMGHIGFMWALMPILRKLYPQDADFKAALKRHMELYNVTPYISTLPMSMLPQWKKPTPPKITLTRARSLMSSLL